MGKYHGANRPNSKAVIESMWDRVQHANPSRPGGPKRSGPHDPANHGSGFDLSKHFEKRRKQPSDRR